MSAIEGVEAELEDQFDESFESGSEEKTHEIGNTSTFGPGCVP